MGGMAPFSLQTLQLDQQARGTSGDGKKQTYAPCTIQGGGYACGLLQWVKDGFSCFLGNRSVPRGSKCLVYKMESTGVQLSTATHQEAGERWSHRSRETTAPPWWKEKAPICVMSFTQLGWKRNDRVSVRLAERSHLHSSHWWPPWTGIWGQSKKQIERIKKKWDVDNGLSCSHLRQTNKHTNAWHPKISSLCVCINFSPSSLRVLS